MRRAVLLMVLAPSIPFLQTRVDRAFGAFRAQEEVLYIWSGEHVRRLAPGFENVMADVYWLRTVQYFGGQRVYKGGKRFDLLEPLVDIAVTLDPRFEMPYRYGAIFLAESPPVGAGDPDAGIALLDRAGRVWPESWQFRQQVAYFTFLFKGDSAAASRILLDASELPGAPYWLRSMAALFLVKGGERQAAREIWRQFLRQSEKGVIRENALENLRRLDALDAADLLSRRAEEHSSRFGRFPASLQDLRSAGAAAIPLADPTGVPYDYDPATGRASISTSSRLWRPE